MAEPVLLDEWQVVPGVLGAVKRAIDIDPRPGRFVVTGPARAATEGDLCPGTGRLVHVPMVGMTVRELLGSASAVPFLDRIASGDEPAPASPSPDLRGYLDLLLRGGFPEPALRMTDVARRHWLGSYVEHLVTRAAEQVEGGRDPNRLKRLVLGPKRYIVDPSLAAGILRVDIGQAIRDGDLLGRLLDTFVVAQLRAELPVAATRPRLYHLRQQQGRIEVDVLAELAGGGLVGIEVKATAAPTPTDARHLATLRDVEPDRFVPGLVLHTGPRAFRLGDRLWAAPISALWA